LPFSFLPLPQLPPSTTAPRNGKDHYRLNPFFRLRHSQIYTLFSTQPKIHQSVRKSGSVNEHLITCIVYFAKATDHRPLLRKAGVLTINAR